MDNITLLHFQSMAALLGWTILHSFWKITVIALVLKLLLFWTSKQDATIRYALSISALFIATFWSGHTLIGTFNEIQVIDNSTTNVFLENTTNSIVVPIERTTSLITYMKELSQEAAQLIAPIMPFLAIFWFIGVLFFASRILVGFFRLHHFSNNGIQLLPRSWDTRLLTLQQLSGIYRPIKVRLSHLVESPITYQFFRPIILLPVSLFTHLSDEQIEVLLLHELAHIKRQDYLINLLQSGIEVLFFYHPLIWWMSKQVRLEREHCCDDRVMNLRHNPMLYAQTLTHIQGQHYSFKTKLAMSATGNTGDFSQRIYRLFQQKEPYARFRNNAAVLLLLLFSGAMMAFYPKQSTPIVTVNAPIILQDTIPQKQHKKGGINVLQINANKNDPFDLKKADGLLTLKTLKGKNPIIYVDNKIYHEWKIDAEGTLLIDISSEEVHSINVFKEEKAMAMFGPDASDGVVYINTKANPNPDVFLKEKKEKLYLATSGKKPLVVVNGKVSKQVVEDIDTDNIATINVIGEESAIKRYGDKGKDDVIEIYTKNHVSKAASANKKLTGKIEGNSFTLQSDDREKKPLVMVDGKVSKQALEDMDTDKIGAMSILKGAAALRKYGEQGKNGVIEVYTKGNEPSESFTKAEQKIKLNGAVGTPKSVEKKELVDSVDKLNEVQPLFIVDGKRLPKKATSRATMENLDPDNIATISVIKDEAALEKYGKEGRNGVVEIITKANKKALKEQEKVMKAKEKKLKIKQKELKVKEKDLKATEKELKIKQKELKAKEKELKANKFVLSGKDIESPASGLSVFPNPTRRLTNIQLNLEQKGKVKVDILNVNGQVVLTLVNEVLDKGVHQFQWNADKQPAGSYFVHFNLDGVFRSKQVVVKK